MTSSKATSSSSDDGRYDVFLSFRGEDTRYGFTGHLYSKLLEAGFHTFLDDDGIERTEDIKSELRKAIREAKVAIVVLSEDYAASGWCLDELALILGRKSTNRLSVLPVFYKVDPSSFRKQTGSVAEAFCNHERRGRGKEKIGQWRTALEQVADLAGITYNSGYEHEYINKVVKVVQNKLRCTSLLTEPFLVGMNSYIKSVNMWLKNDLSDVGMLVLYGIGGVGKTTLAKEVYIRNRTRFEGGSFLSIRDFFEQNDGLLALQRKLLFDLRGWDNMEKPPSIDDGWELIRRALRYKGQCLFVFDDIDEPNQFDSIIRMKKWLSKGSKIIITTRRLDLSNAQDIYMMQEVRILFPEESLKLFCWHAFGQKHPKEDYLEQVKYFVHYCEGLPLALRVIGSSLSGKTYIQWKKQLEKSKELLDRNIFEKLKISYESLDDEHDRIIFLDVACFFVGKDEDYVTTILEGCGFHAVVGIQNLIDRCLLTTNERNKFAMHQLIQDMGKKIVCDKLMAYPEKWSRLWDHEHSCNVLYNKSGTKYIEGLILEFQTADTKVVFETDSFKKMENLRLLQLNYACVKGSYKENITRKLKWLCWHGFPANSIDEDFPLEGLVVLDMKHSNLKHMWKGTKHLRSLKILNFSHCHLLSDTADFSSTPNLEKVLLKDCPNLVKLHRSFSSLEKLIVLNIKGCTNLRKLPKNFAAVKSLGQLIISGCSKLGITGDELRMMSSLTSFFADGIDLNKNFSPCAKRNHYHSCISLPSSLVNLSLVACNLSDSDLPSEIGSLHMLQHLNLGGNPFHNLPVGIKCLPNLEVLDVHSCIELKKLELSSSRIKKISIVGCQALEKLDCETSKHNISYSGNVNLRQWKDVFAWRYIQDMDIETLNLMGFFNLDAVIDCKVISKDGVFVYDRSVREKSSEDAPCWFDCEETSLLTSDVRYEGGVFSTSFPGQKVPSWFSFIKSMDISLVAEEDPKKEFMSFVVPSHPHAKLRGFNLCIVYTMCGGLIEIEVINKSKNLVADYSVSRFIQRSETLVWLSYWPFGILFEGGDYIEVSFRLEQSNRWLDAYGEIKECGINILYDENHEKNQRLLNLESWLSSGYFDEYLDVDKSNCLVPTGFFYGDFCIKMNCRPISFCMKLASELSAEALNSMGFSNLDSMTDAQVKYECCVYSTNFPGSEVPHWFKFKCTDSSIFLKVPSHSKGRLRGLNLCLVYTILTDDEEEDEDIDDEDDFDNDDDNNKDEDDDSDEKLSSKVSKCASVTIKVINKSKNLVAQHYLSDSVNVELSEPVVWLSYWMFGVLFDGGDHMVVSFDCSDSFQINSHGIQFLFAEEEKEICDLDSLLLSGYLVKEDNINPEGLVNFVLNVNKLNSLVPTGFFDGDIFLYKNWRSMHQFERQAVSLCMPTEVIAEDEEEKAEQINSSNGNSTEQSNSNFRNQKGLIIIAIVFFCVGIIFQYIFSFLMK